MATKITNPAVALAVINEAKAQGVYGDPVPESQEDQFKAANDLMEAAEQARAAGVGGDMVLAVLNAAATATAAVAPAAPEAPNNPFAAATEPVAPAPAVAAAPVAAPAAFSIDSIIPGYDDLKKDEILAALSQLSPEQVEQVKAYEASDGERAFVANFQPAAPAAPAPAAPAPAVATPVAAPVAAPAAIQFADSASLTPEQQQTTEPWAGYASSKINEIEPILVSASESHPDAKVLFSHVWNYESAQKKPRTRLLGKLKAIAEGAAPAPAAVAPVAPVAEPADVDPEPPFNAQAPAPTQVSAPASTGVSTEQVTESIALPFEGSTQRALDMVRQEFPEIEVVANIPSIPSDFTALSDVQVRQYASLFNAVQARLLYLRARAEGHAADADTVATGLIDEFIREQQFEAKTTVTEKEAKAKGQANVIAALHVKRDWTEVARQLKAHIEIYDLTCKRLSREQAGREADAANSHTSVVA